MGLVAVAKTADLIHGKQAVLSESDKEFILQFAFSTSDKELTNKLIDELIEVSTENKEAVFRKYEVLTGFKPDWIKKIEELLVTLEMYRIQEEKAIQTLSEILTAYGIDLAVEDIRELPAGKVKEHLSISEAMQR